MMLSTKHVKSKTLKFSALFTTEKVPLFAKESFSLKDIAFSVHLTILEVTRSENTIL